MEKPQQRKSLYFSVPADFISFSEEKKKQIKKKQKKKTTICTEVWEAVIDPNIGWFWAINIKWYWHDWTKHDHTQHIAQMKKEKRTIEKMTWR